MEGQGTLLLSVELAQPMKEGLNTFDNNIASMHFDLLNQNSNNIAVRNSWTQNGISNSNCCELSEDVEILSTSLLICDIESLTLDVGEIYNSYSWSTGAITSTILIESAGTYSVTVTDGNGCISSDEITISTNTNCCPAEAPSLSNN